MSPATTRAFVRAIVVSLVACGSGDDDLTANEAACDAEYDARRAYGERCTSEIVSPARDATRRTRARALCLKRLSAPGANIGAAFVRDCAARLASIPCGMPEELGCVPPPGDLEDGAPCTDDSQCQSTHCSTRGDGSAASLEALSLDCGSCAPLIPVGKPCSPGEETGACARGAVCRDGKCMAREAPTLHADGEPCFDGMPCDAGLYCKSEGFVCTRKVRAGDPCEAAGACEDGLRCIEAACREPLREGERPCTLREDCAAGLACDESTGACAPVVFVGIGAPCASGTTVCEQGVCGGAWPDNTCRAFIPDGAPCGPGIEGTCDEFSKCYRGTCAPFESLCE